VSRFGLSASGTTEEIGRRSGKPLFSAGCVLEDAAACLKTAGVVDQERASRASLSFGRGFDR
jgi:hypothetical protein